MYKYIIKNGQGPLFDNYVTKGRQSNASNGSKGGKSRSRQSYGTGLNSRQSSNVSYGSNGGKTRSRQSYATGLTSRTSDVSTVSSKKKLKIQRAFEEEGGKSKNDTQKNSKLVRWRDKCKEIIQKSRDEHFQVSFYIFTDLYISRVGWGGG